MSIALLHTKPIEVLEQTLNHVVSVVRAIVVLHIIIDT